jgi:hypothetical protein
VEGRDNLIEGVLALLFDLKCLLCLAFRLELVSLQLIALGLDTDELVLDIFDDPGERALLLLQDRSHSLQLLMVPVDGVLGLPDLL